MAGIREAVEDRPDLETAAREAARLAEAIRRYAAQVERAAAPAAVVAAGGSR